jgi:hypothetical protein
MTQLSAASAATLRAAIVWTAAGEELEAQTTIGDLPPDELDTAVEVLTSVLEKVRNLRGAYQARVEAAAT